ncbi:MAG TPA: hypothetical protein VMS56_01285 [Thermoanaerobaculia bacterium]|nr:hypothetical protein [Thermoanaerobaculia bacterium]
MPRPAQEPEFARRARALSSALLALHRALLGEVRGEYERTHGPQSPVRMFDLLVNDPAFAWLRPLSGAVAQLDELLATETDRAPYRNLVKDLHQMLGSGDPAHPFAGTYGRYLQSPPVAGAHGAGRKALTRFEELL